MLLVLDACSLAAAAAAFLALALLGGFSLLAALDGMAIGCGVPCGGC